jgi:hypothetical protein
MSPDTASQETDLACQVSSPHHEAMREIERTVGDLDIATIRRDERMRMASLLYTSKDTIAGFAGDKRQVVDLVAFMLNLDGDA